MNDTSNQIKSPQIVKIVLVGTLGVVAALILLLIASLTIYHNNYVIWRVLVGAAILVYLIIAAFCFKHARFDATAWMLILLYTAIGTGILAIWSINAPIGVLVLGFVIFLSGVMLGARYIIPVTIGVVLLLFCLQTLDHFNLIDPDRSLLSVESTFGDVASYGTIFAIFALISWLTRRQTEASLVRALSAERALKKEKILLASRLKQRTRMLREAQLEEMRQLYDFAELGQLTTAILHDLANQLSVLTLDIDDLGHSDARISTVSQAKESIRNIDDMVKRVRKKINNSTKPERFKVSTVIDEVLDILRPLAEKSHILISMEASRPSPYIVGDPLRLSQVLTVLVNNARTADGVKNIHVSIKLKEGVVSIMVADDGIGIPAGIRKKLFEPMRSTKANGLGIGLYIAKQIIITHFKGKIYLKDGRRGTKFVIELPLPTTAPTPPTSSAKA